MTITSLIGFLAPAILIAGAATAHNANLPCPNAPPPKIEVNINRGAPHIDTNISLEQLRSAVKGRHPSPVFGLYVGTLQYGIEIDDTTRSVAPDGVCATPRYAVLTARLNRVIHIPREFSDDACLGALAREHEAKHAYADVEALDRFHPLLAPAMREAVHHDTAVSTNTAEEAVAKLSRGLVAAVDHVFGEMTVARQHRDAAIDSPAELERLKRVCGVHALKTRLSNALALRQCTAVLHLQRWIR